jgi:hypothetical protein
MPQLEPALGQLCRQEKRLFLSIENIAALSRRLAASGFSGIAAVA